MRVKAQNCILNSDSSYITLTGKRAMDLADNNRPDFYQLCVCAHEGGPKYISCYPDPNAKSIIFTALLTHLSIRFLFNKLTFSPFFFKWRFAVT